MSKKFSFLYLYLTDACNLKCIHCWQSAPLEGKGKFSMLKFEDCKSFLDNAVEMGLKNITFSGGEPLLNKDFHKFARYFHDRNIHMSMETNGILISNDEILQCIRECDVNCSISLDGVNPGTHNKHRGCDDAFDKTLESINKLEDAGIHYGLIMAISHFNYKELVPMADWIKDSLKYCDKLKLNVVSNLGRGKEMEEDGILFKAEELTKITEEIADLEGNYPFLMMLHVDPLFFSFKHLLKGFACGGNCGYQTGLSVLSNGKISICSLGKQVDRYVFGHVSTIDLKEVWENNPLLCEIHDEPQKKLKGICGNCVFKRQCYGGCRAAALCYYDDFFAPHPMCQTFYESGKMPPSKLISSADKAEYVNMFNV